MNQHTAFGLGRVARPDTRDSRFPLRSLIPAGARTSGKQLWQIGDVLDQGQTPQCVGFAWRDWLDAAPVSEALLTPPNAQSIYFEANANDGDPQKHEGTTVRAGAQVIQKRGQIVSYHWATDINDVIGYVLNVAPVVFGTDWERRMFTPSKTGLVSLGGGIAGGHAYLCYGVDTTKKHLYFLNSWGSSWGQNGAFHMTFSTVKRLLARQGEACAALGKLP